MSISKNYMQKIKYAFAAAVFAVALVFIAMPNATYASYGGESWDTGTDSWGATDWNLDTGWGGYDNTSTNWNLDTGWGGYDNTSTNWNLDTGWGGYDNTVTPSYGCSNCGGSSIGGTSYPVGGRIPSFSYGNSSVPVATLGGGGSIPGFTYSNSGATAQSAANPINTNTATNTNYSPSNAVASNNSTTTVNVSNNIVVNVPSSGNNNDPYIPRNDLSVSCSIYPSNNVTVGQDVNFYSSASGGSGSYSYSWTGSDGLYSSGQSFTGRFYSTGSKYATVTVYSGGQSRSQTCNVNVSAVYSYQAQASNVTLISGTAGQIAPASGIYLNQIPATGISLSWKIALFALGLLAWSLFAAFIVSKRKKNSSSIDMNAITEFKARMLALKSR